jgi:hypothetical protein
VIAAEAKLLWAGLKLQLTGFGNADSCDPHRLDENDCGKRVKQASARDEPGAKFSGIVAAKCRFGGGHFVAGVWVGQRPAPDDKQE